MIARRCTGPAILLWAACTAGAVWAEDPEVPVFEVPPIVPQEPPECAAHVAQGTQDLAPVFELMKSSREQAVACVGLLDRLVPGWHTAPGADQLVAPFVSYLLGDGTARGLQRHAIFIQLLGHLEKIAPDWRYREAVRAMMPEIILGSIVEDPFVADFWKTALREMDPEWRKTEAARALLPTIYRLAMEEENQPGGVRNKRPEQLLKEISWVRYARFYLATRVLDSWPKRVAWIFGILLVLALLLRRMRRAPA